MVSEERRKRQECQSTSSIMELSRACKAGNIDMVIVRDLDVLWDNDSLLLWLEDNFPVPFIGAEDLDSTKENLNIETLEYEREERHHSDEHKQALSENIGKLISEKQDEGFYVGRIPFGYLKTGKKADFMQISATAKN